MSSIDKNSFLFQAENISISYKTKRGLLKAVQGASFSIRSGEAAALIGESGCGKTTLASSIVRALPNAASVTDGRLLFRKQDGQGVNLLDLNRKKMRRVLWSDISMVFQASQSSFNPVRKISTQFIDTVKAHNPEKSKKEILKKSGEILEMVMLEPDKILNAYPHEISGGMKQRTLIALALLLDPRLVILDEPTTALDLLTQEKILEMLKRLKVQMNFSLLFITHDLGIVSELADYVVTMYAGRIIEKVPVREFFEEAAHPYSRGLIKAIPRLTTENSELYSIPGSPPDMIDDLPGCPFYPRCSRREDICNKEMPEMQCAGTREHLCACWHPEKGVLSNG